MTCGMTAPQPTGGLRAGLCSRLHGYPAAAFRERLSGARAASNSMFRPSVPMLYLIYSFSALFI